MRRDCDVRIVFDEMGGPLTGSNGTLMLVRMPEHRLICPISKNNSPDASGLMSRQHTFGVSRGWSKPSKMAQRDLRRLLIIGASAVVRWASRRGAVEGYWLSRMIGKKPPMLITVVLANRMVPVA